ncbi:hypothetical protein [Qipengyuania flava]|uniref:hypothetical protein n=1 Tax=Qipengyuania flava TaxID=192812 RepID=UPI00273EA36B|nr:hypothetical protein [Qipengyuania flava]
MVENAEVEAAMVSLKSGIDHRLAQEALQVLNLQLAHACRSSLGKSWNTHAWGRHYSAASCMASDSIGQHRVDALHPRRARHGLHFEDVRKLLEVLYRLVEQENSVIVI